MEAAVEMAVEAEWAGTRAGRVAAAAPAAGMVAVDSPGVAMAATVVTVERVARPVDRCMVHSDRPRTRAFAPQYRCPCSTGRAFLRAASCYRCA